MFRFFSLNAHLSLSLSLFHHPAIKFSHFPEKYLERNSLEMASLTSIATPYRSSSYPSSSQALRVKTTLFSAGVRSPATSSSLLTIRSASTKPAKPAAEVEWKQKRELLLEKRVRGVDVKEALRLQKENNFVILDVRPEAEFKDGHPPGAINVEMYRLIREWTPWDIARRLGFAFFGIFSGTEENPEFIQSVEAKLDKDAKIIVACSSAGTMKPTQNLPEGQQSRSLIAAYVLVLNGYKNVFHMEGGIYSWSKEGLPIETEEED